MTDKQNNNKTFEQNKQQQQQGKVYNLTKICKYYKISSKLFD